MKADEVLAQLKTGNARFVAGRSEWLQHPTETLPQEQTPMAAILGCADARVPTELIFDRTLNDLFVVRVAGNIAGQSQIGSLEFAVAQLNVPLLVVLGHERCGAVLAAMQPASQRPQGALGQLVAQIAPVVGDADVDNAADVSETVRANVRHSVETLLRESDVVRDAVDRSAVRVVGAVYNLASGEVQFL